MLPLRDYQIEGVGFLIANRTAYLADDAGLGKTAQMLRAADAMLLPRILVICEPISVVSWMIETPKWQIFDRKVFLIENHKSDVPKGPVVAILKYSTAGTMSADQMRRFVRKLDRFDIVIIDEAQNLRNWSARRTRAVFGHKLDNCGIITRFGLDTMRPPVTWLASATPTPNHAGELYPMLRALFADVLARNFGGVVPTHDEYLRRYCNVRDGDFGQTIAGNNNKNIGQLRDSLRPVFLSRTKADVAAELGAINYVTLPVEVPASVKRSVNSELADHLSLSGDDILNEEGAEQNASVSAVRRELGEAKAQEAVTWIKNFLADNPKEKLVVFAHHRSVLNVIEQGVKGSNLFRYVRVDGAVNDSARANAVALFQGDDATRLFIGQITAASTSITLTAASTVLVVEPAWTPATNYQAISRCHRLGQTSPVTAYLLYAADTLDARITQILRRKATDAEKLTGKPQGGAFNV
jgi:SWI/SNF-related matrix-associated actin-dependent regulator 1 of chromatin subfamily A